MTRVDPARKEELKDKAEKVKDARQAAEAPDASDRARADLKLLEQDLVAERMKADREARGEGHASSRQPQSSDPVDKKLDAALKASFPGSDAVSSLEPAPPVAPKPDK